MTLVRNVMVPAGKTDILNALQRDILRLQGFKSVHNTALDTGLGPIKDAFPNAAFPLGAVHEFLATREADAAATCGFISGLLHSLMGSKGTTLWISASRTLYPPALKNFGLAPEHFIFIDVQKEKDVILAMDEALKCGALTAVVGEMNAISFIHSRRFQLAVEQSQVTGFLLCNSPRKPTPTASVSRWRITPLPSEPVDDDLPGIGFPKWRVELLRIRNGKPGVWDLQWTGGRFVPVYQGLSTPVGAQQKKAG